MTATSPNSSLTYGVEAPSGKSFSASLTLFLKLCHIASRLKYLSSILTCMIEDPVSEMDVSFLISGILRIFSSNFLVIRSSILCGDIPGNLVVTIASRLTMLGSSWEGKVK